MKSILLHKRGTWALTLREEERLKAYHRKQLKKILNTRYPKKINKSLYKICQEKPLSLQLFVHYISLVIFFEETNTFLQINQQELILSPMVNLVNSVQQRSRTDSTPNQTTLKQRPQLAQDRKCWRRKLPKCHRLRTGKRNGNKSVSQSMTYIPISNKPLHNITCRCDIQCHYKYNISY